MDEDIKIAAFAIERSDDPTEVRLRFMDDEDREAAVTLSNIEPGQDTSDAALLRVAADLVEHVGSIEMFVENSVMAATEG